MDHPERPQSPAAPSTSPSVDESQRIDATFADYVAMARPDHWVKQVFVLPGIVLAYLVHPVPLGGLLVVAAVGLLAASLIASANYLLNEWLDLEFDRHHPLKSARPAVQKRIDPRLVVAGILLLAGVGCALAAWIGPLFLATCVAFLASGFVYNVPGIRTKDRAYLDVLSEAINNPIRLTLGWAMVWPEALPPSSLLLSYWMGGAFLMAIKRFAEYRSIGALVGVEALGLYRRSFRYYDENRLIVSAFLYGQLAAFFGAVFLIKYRVEYILTLPLVALLFAAYVRVGLKRDSTAQAPEKLFRETALMVIVVLLAIAFLALSWVDLPFLDKLSEPHYLFLPEE